LPAKDFNRLKESKEGQHLAFYTSDSYDMVAMGFNTSRATLQDRYTRQALSHLVNIPDLIQGSQQGMAYPTVGLINPHDQRYYNDSLAPVLYAPKRTIALLKQAGWRKQNNNRWVRSKPGEPDQNLSLTISYRTSEPAYEAAAMQFRIAAAAIGIPVQLQPTEASLLSSKLRKGEVDVYLRMLYGNPFNFNFASILHSRSIGLGNYSRFGTPASDRLIDAIAQEDDSTRKVHLLRRFQTVMQDESPLVVLYFMRNRLAAAKHLAHLNVSGLKPYYYVTTIISKASPSN
jgi:peptide/nickel transport system substrate-binding protein